MIKIPNILFKKQVPTEFELPVISWNSEFMYWPKKIVKRKVIKIVLNILNACFILFKYLSCLTFFPKFPLKNYTLISITYI